MLVNIQAYQEARPVNSFAKDYADVMLVELDKKFPNCGTENELYAFAQILHPFYRESLFRKAVERIPGKPSR